MPIDRLPSGFGCQVQVLLEIIITMAKSCLSFLIPLLVLLLVIQFSIAQSGEKKVTILSLDGGAIRGIISSRILRDLESKIQKLDGPNAFLADYFDVIAGTSTGGLMTAMLTTPGPNKRPLYAAKDITQFFFDNGAKIFSGPTLFGPKYDGKYLASLVRGLTGNYRVNQTLTNVVIPTFDIKHSQPVIFTTADGKAHASKNALISDICLGTSAAPTYLPPVYFETKDEQGRTHSFNLVDGGLAANHPALVALLHVGQQIKQGQFKSSPDMQSLDATRTLVLSLGTGIPRYDGGYKAKDAARWGLLNWVFFFGKNPLIDMFMDGASDIVDMTLTHLFQAQNSEANYLRIQEDNLTSTTYTFDLTTPANLRELSEIGDNLLKKPLSRINLETGRPVPIPGGGTNEEALTRFAQLLSEQRKLRLATQNRH